jgi:hypothetical protein
VQRVAPDAKWPLVRTTTVMLVAKEAAITAKRRDFMVGLRFDLGVL